MDSTQAPPPAAAPAWISDPSSWFPCSVCRHGLSWARELRGEVLVCTNGQCAVMALEVPIWQAQQHREDLGLEPPMNPAGWPRPILDGLPVPYLTPVTAGSPWWKMSHGQRLLACQNDWLCQVCGLPLEPAAWVLLDRLGAVADDAAMHDRCLRVATATCPHLRSPTTDHRPVLVQRRDIHADGRPLTSRRAVARQDWSVPDQPRT